MIRFLLFLLTLAIAAVASAASLTADTIPGQNSLTEKPDSTATDLKEVIVEGINEKMEGTTITYYPAANVKKLASDAIDLLERMAMSTITIDPRTKALSTTSGQAVSLFIDYIPASQMDINGLRGQDVKKVEVIDFPSDPRFRGNSHVINIILKRKEYGGYTKIRDSQNFISTSDNSGAVFSRLNRGRMTYDLYVGSSFSHTTHRTSTATSRYDFTDGPVSRIEEATGNKEKTWEVPLTFRATYATNYTQIINTVGYSFSDVYDDNTSGYLYFKPQGAAGGYNFLENNSRRNMSVNYNGDFFFWLPRDWSFSVTPLVSYSHTNSHHLYETDVPNGAYIMRDARDNAVYAYLYATAEKYFGDKHELSLTLGAYDTANKVRYEGTDNATADMNKLEGHADITYRFSMNNRWNAGAAFQFDAARTWTDQTAISNFSPSLITWASYNPTAKSRFGLDLSIRSKDMSYMSSDNILLRKNEFEFIKGNPYIKPYPEFHFSLAYTYIPANAFSMSAYLNYDRADKMTCVSYEYNDARDALIVSNLNKGHYSKISTGLNLTGRLLSNRLILQLRPGFRHFNVNNFFRMVDNRAHFSANAQFYAGNFSFAANYSHKVWTVKPAGGILDINPAYYYVEATWGNGNWNITLQVKNFFRYNYHGQTSRIVTSDYAWTDDINIPAYHMNLTLRAVYTIGYGKKVRRGNEVGAQKRPDSVIR